MVDYNKYYRVVTLEEFDDYSPEIGEDFILKVNDGKSDLIVHPYYYEDEIGIFPDDIGGFDVYDEDGNFISDCSAKEEILECI